MQHESARSKLSKVKTARTKLSKVKGAFCDNAEKL